MSAEIGLVLDLDRLGAIVVALPDNPGRMESAEQAYMQISLASRARRKPTDRLHDARERFTATPAPELFVVHKAHPFTSTRPYSIGWRALAPRTGKPDWRFLHRDASAMISFFYARMSM